MKEQILAVQRMQDYISAHLSEKISLADLANAAMFSPWYARRLFLQWTGLSPADYIRRLRLSRSALQLRDEGGRIVDAAMDLGFGSVDGYQRAFFREFGCNPREYARHPVPLYLFTPYGAKFRNQERCEKEMKEVKTVFVQIVEKPERKVILKRGQRASDYWEYCQEVGCDVWGLLTSMKSITGEPVCLWLPEHCRLPHTSRYVQGVEVEPEYAGPIPEGFDEILLPKAQYLMFRGEPFAEEDYEQAIEEIWKAERKYDPTPMGYEWDNSNPRIQLEPRGERGYIELLPVRKREK